jgi:hypothetical protein
MWIFLEPKVLQPFSSMVPVARSKKAERGSKEAVRHRLSSPANGLGLIDFHQKLISVVA